MSNVVRISLDRLPAELNLGEQKIRRAIARGALAGAHRGRAIMVRNTPTDQGQLRGSWKVKAGKDEFDGVGENLAELINDAPHISVVELGARPHKVSPEGWAAIYEWVRRHYRSEGSVYVMGGGGRMAPRGKKAVTGPFRGDDPRIEAITNAIVYRIRKHGQRATLFVRNSVDDLRVVMAYELDRQVKRAVDEISKAKGGKP